MYVPPPSLLPPCDLPMGSATTIPVMAVRNLLLLLLSNALFEFSRFGLRSKRCDPRRAQLHHTAAALVEPQPRRELRRYTSLVLSPSRGGSRPPNKQVAARPPYPTEKGGGSCMRCLRLCMWPASSCPENRQSVRTAQFDPSKSFSTYRNSSQRGMDKSNPRVSRKRCSGRNRP